MVKKTDNPFTTKKKNILNIFSKKKKKIEEVPVEKEKSTYTKPGLPYSVTAKVINCTPPIPTFYKLYRLYTDSNSNFSFNKTKGIYKEMYNTYIENKKLLDNSGFTKYINIIIGMKIEVDPSILLIDLSQTGLLIIEIQIILLLYLRLIMIKL